MTNIFKALQAAAGNAGVSLYVEDVFSTYLYTGTGATQTITNGIDLDGEGGLVWLKGRSSVIRHSWFDTARGVNKYLMSNTTDGETTVADQLTNFNSDGFTLGSDASTGVNGSGTTYASWTFRKAEKFFDVVTYTGTGSARTIAHNLGSVPGCIIVKTTSTTWSWYVYHRGLGTTSGYPDILRLDQTNAAISGSATVWSAAPTSTEFSIGTSSTVNQSGQTYVAYLFAHDAGGFGDDESIIKCGSYTGNGSSTGPSVSLGWEPQWLLIKNASLGTENWVIFDAMRGMTAGAGDVYLRPNASDAESAATTALSPTPDGFELTGVSGEWNGNGNEMIYIAIRRPMKTPESGTEVFNPDIGDSGTDPRFESSFTADFALYRDKTGGASFSASRLTGTGTLQTQSTNAEASNANILWDNQTGLPFTVGNSNYIAHIFKRATGFFDVVAYTGTGVSGRTVAHNLGVAPELLIVKHRSLILNDPAFNQEWSVYSSELNKEAYLNETTQFFSGSSYPSAPTSSEFIVGSASKVNHSGVTYIAYLFATVAGVSKVGSYTGTGADLNVDCGFSAGARFILIKRTDSTGDWYVWDSARGIVAGNDPYLLLNSTAAEVTSTDYIDPLASGFTVTSSAPAALNASGGNYIFLAIS